ncbi:unnamed protein product [Calypogeia fissa]
MATEEVPATKESLDEKLGDLNIDEPEKFEDATDGEMPEAGKAKEVLEELTESPPKLHHVETKDTTDPVSEPPSEGGVVKAEVPEAFAEELKSDHNIVPPSEEKPTSTVETVAKESGPETRPETAEKEPATREFPVQVTHEEVETKSPSKMSAIGEKITSTFHKIVGKE